MIEHIAGFANYFASIRRRTLSFVRAIPADRLDWSPRAGEFTCGELVRHLAAAPLAPITALFLGAYAANKVQGFGSRRPWGYSSSPRFLACCCRCRGGSS